MPFSTNDRPPSTEPFRMRLDRLEDVALSHFWPSPGAAAIFRRRYNAGRRVHIARTHTQATNSPSQAAPGWLRLYCLCQLSPLLVCTSLLLDLVCLLYARGLPCCFRPICIRPVA